MKPQLEVVVIFLLINTVAKLYIECGDVIVSTVIALQRHVVRIKRIVVTRSARRRTHGTHVRVVNFDHSLTFLLNFEFSRFFIFNPTSEFLASTFCN